MDYDDFGGAASGAAYGFMEIKFKPKGVCSQSIRLDLTDGIVHNVRFAGGCSGNAQGISRLGGGVGGQEGVGRLGGVRCGF